MRWSCCFFFSIVFCVLLTLDLIRHFVCCIHFNKKIKSVHIFCINHMQIQWRNEFQEREREKKTRKIVLVREKSLDILFLFGEKFCWVFAYVNYFIRRIHQNVLHKYQCYT